MKILVCGGTGLVGRYIVEGLLSAGHEVTVGARKPPAPGFFTGSTDFAPLHLDPEINQADVFAGQHAFIHAAFDHLPGRYRGGEGDDPERFRRLNEDGSKALFAAAKEMGVQRTIFLSSRAVYDGVPAGVSLTEDLPLSPTSLYGQIKLSVETFLASLATPEFVTASLRSTGVYGSLRPNKWDKLITDAVSGETVAARAGTEVHGDDVAQAVRLLLDREATDISGQSFNLSDIVVDTRMIVEGLQLDAELPPPAVLGANVMETRKIRRIGWFPGGMRRFQVTIDELSRQLNAAS